MKKISKPILALALIIGIFSFSSQAKAASNPSGTGQPKAECGADNALMSPNGFGTSGFATAETKYAGSDGTASVIHSNSTKAVSQYDIACYQLSNN